MILASLLLDVVSSTEAQMASNLSNLLTRLTPGGILVLQGSLGESSYTVGGASLPALTVDEAAVRRVIGECGMALERWKVCTKESAHYFAVLKRKL